MVLTNLTQQIEQVFEQLIERINKNTVTQEEWDQKRHAEIKQLQEEVGLLRSEVAKLKRENDYKVFMGSK